MRASISFTAVVTALFVWLSASAQTNAAPVVTAVGLDSLTQGAWRTASVSKSFDVDGNNVYGSAGYRAFATGNYLGGTAGSPLFTPTELNGLPSWVTISIPSNVNPTLAGVNSSFSGAYSMIDDPTTTPGASPTQTNSGLVYVNSATANTQQYLLNLNFGPGTPAETFRLGIFENSGSSGGITSFTLGGATQSWAGAGFIRYAFFDVTGAANGDILTISGQVATTGPLGLSGISLDVPEPTSVATVLVAGAFGISLRRGRTHRLSRSNTGKVIAMSCKSFARAFVVAFAVVLVGLFTTASAFAAPVINAVGLDNATQADWRTTTTIKPLDLDHDNVYGTTGYVAYNTTGAGTPTSLPSWLTITFQGITGLFGDPAYPAIDNPTLTPGSPVADVSSGIVYRQDALTGSLIKLHFDTSAPLGIVRIGVMENNAMSSQESYTLSSGANSATQFVGAVENSPINPRHYAFFDVIDANNVDVILSGTIPNDGGTTNNGLSALSIDFVVPEPASAATLAVMGAVGCLSRRRHAA